MIQYPGISYLTGYNQNPDIVGRFGQGFDLGRGIRAEQDAPGVFAAYLDSLGSGTGNAGGSELSLMGLAPTDEAMRNQQTVMGSHQAALGATDPVLDAYFRNTRQAESGGNDAARNPNSTATGRYQFLESTWNDLARRHPNLGLTPDGRTDPAQQERAMRAFTAENARTLSGAGVPVNPGTLYAAHFLGPQGAANVLRQPDNASMMAVVGPEVVKANPFLADMSVGDFKQWAAGKGGASNGGYQPPLADGGAPGTSAQMMGMQQGQTAQAQMPPREVMLDLFRNPVTRPLAIDALQRAQATPEGLKPTSDMTEYMFALSQGYNGTFQQYQTDMKKAGATNVTTNVGGESLTPGQKKIDEAFADDYIRWTSGGFADSAKMLEQLTEAVGILEQGGDVTGAKGILPRELQAFLNTDGLIAREAVEEVVQRNLREVLGAQFTEREGERLIARAFNPLLSPQENAKRVRRLLTTVQSAAQAKQAMVDYFNANGTLRGYSGPRPSEAEFTSLSREFGKSPDEDRAAAQDGDVPTVNTREEYDELPSGTVFVDAEDGKQYRKP